jgi:hypothetical protein
MLGFVTSDPKSNGDSHGERGTERRKNYAPLNNNAVVLDGHQPFKPVKDHSAYYRTQGPRNFSGFFHDSLSLETSPLQQYTSTMNIATPHRACAIRLARTKPPAISGRGFDNSA